jgi:hypothetical protein
MLAENQAEPMVKGLAFHTVLGQLRRLRGDDVADRAMAALRDDVRDAVVRGAIVTTGWYPISWYRELWRAIDASAGEGHALVRLIGRESLYSDISTIYRPLLRLLSPERIVSMGAKYFNRIYDTGSFRVLSREDNRMSVRFERCRGFDRNMWIEVVGSIEAFITLSGLPSPSVHVVAGGGDTDDWADMTARW